MKESFNITSALDYIVENLVKKLRQDSINNADESLSDTSKSDDRLYSPTQLFEEFQLSKNIIYSLIKNGLPYYQIGGKKLISKKEFFAFIEQYRIELPISQSTYHDFEKSFRNALKRGAKLDKLISKFKEGATNPKSISELALWLWENGYAKESLQGSISIQEFNSLTKKYDYESN